MNERDVHFVWRSRPVSIDTQRRTQRIDGIRDGTFIKFIGHMAGHVKATP